MDEKEETMKQEILKDIEEREAKLRAEGEAIINPLSKRIAQAVLCIMLVVNIGTSIYAGITEHNSSNFVIALLCGLIVFMDVMHEKITKELRHYAYNLTAIHQVQTEYAEKVFDELDKKEK